MAWQGQSEQLQHSASDDGLMRKLLAGYLLAVGLSVGLISAPPAGATENVLVCAPGAGVATYVTSCPFAENVAAAYSGGGWEYAYSPVTGDTGSAGSFPGNSAAITVAPQHTT